MVTALACRREKAVGCEKARCVVVRKEGLSLSLLHSRSQRKWPRYVPGQHSLFLITDVLLLLLWRDVPAAFLTATDRPHVGGTVCGLAKACDCVNRVNLLAKSLCYGIRAVAEDWFRSWLTNRRQNFEVQSPNLPQNCLFLCGTLKCGVPQVSILCPPLSILYIYIYIYIQGVPGGMCQTSGECSLC